MARRMKGATLTHIAAVDRPAQKGAVAVILKRDAPAGDPAIPAIPATAVAYLKRDLTDTVRKELAGTGAALPDGSFPIQNRGDLKNAVQAFPCAKNQARTKAHIISRARALDATSMLPATWKTSKLLLLDGVTNAQAMEAFAPLVKSFTDEMAAAGFEGDAAQAVAGEFANALVQDVDDAVSALSDVATEIDADPAITDKPGALQDSASQFMAHIQGFAPELTENALVADALGKAGLGFNEGGALTKRGELMGTALDNLKKSLNLSATATDADIEKAVATAQAGAAFAVNVLKMSPEHLGYMAKSDKMTDETKKQEFAALTAEKRDAFIKANPCPPDGDEDDMPPGKKKTKNDEVLKVDGREIRKSVVGEDTFAVLKSQQAAIEKAEDDRQTAVIEKRVTTELPLIGKGADLAVMLRSIGKHDAKLAESVETVLKSAQEKIAKGGLFTELGNSGTGAAANAASEIETKAQEMVTKGTIKSIYKARDAVRRENPELAKREAAERSQSSKAA